MVGRRAAIGAKSRVRRIAENVRDHGSRSVAPFDRWLFPTAQRGSLSGGRGLIALRGLIVLFAVRAPRQLEVTLAKEAPDGADGPELQELVEDQLDRFSDLRV